MPKDSVSKPFAGATTVVNIIFHGSFGFLLEGNSVLASTPKVPEHTYAARVSGKCVPNYATPLTLVPFQPETVTLCPNDRQCSPQHPPNTSRSLYVAKQLGSDDLQLSNAYYTLRLPAPTNFKPLRCMHFNSDGVWGGEDMKYTQGRKTPATAMLLQYDNFVLSDFSLTLRDCQEHRGVDLIPPIDQSGNIHFYADPINEMPEMNLKRAMPSHQTQAFALLAGLYKLKLTFTPPATVGGGSVPIADPPTPIPPYVTREDELLLSELIGPQIFDQHKGLYGRNCTNVIVKPLPPNS